MPLSARILCPGTSLRGYRRGDFSGLTLAVNRAAIGFDCDAWVCLDWASVLEWAPAVRGSPMLLTTRPATDSLCRRGFFWRGLRGQTIAVEEAVRQPWIPGEACAGFEPPERFTLYSLSAALVYAAWRGAGSIDVFGCDWAGTSGFDADDRGEDRSPARWQRERGFIEQTIEPWLAGMGIGWERMGAA